jgi:hypothetical protein
LSIDFGLARYNTNGSLDPTFDGDGKVTTSFGDSDTADEVAIQADGKIVAAGSAAYRAMANSPWPGTTPTDPWTPRSTATAR